MALFSAYWCPLSRDISSLRMVSASAAHNAAQITACVRHVARLRKPDQLRQYVLQPRHWMHGFERYHNDLRG